MLITRLKEELKQSRLHRLPCVVSLLSVVISDAERIAKDCYNVTDEEVVRAIKKVVQGNKETISHLNKEDIRLYELSSENKYIESFLPKTLSIEEIRCHIDNIKIDDWNPTKSGKIIGQIMSYFKNNSLVVDGTDVKNLVAERISALMGE